MKPVKIAENIYWVGAIDWNLRNFHGYLTQKGSTYNSYLIIDEKITLIDTVKSYLCDEMISRISEIIDPKKIDYIICNHVEMDHSGSLPCIMDIAPSAEIVTCKKGEMGINAHFKNNWNFKIVKSGDTLDIGKNKISFVETPMVHWPDNMVSYLQNEKILFSNDAFGQHLATSERFDDEYSIEMIFEQARKYYANIVLPYSKQVLNALKVLKELEIDIIAPSHGLLWRKYVKEIIDRYNDWCSGKTKNKAVIIYDTMWDSTKKIALSIENAFESKGIITKMLDLKYNHISDIMTELMISKYVCVGSPTLNNNMLPTVASFLTYMKGLRPPDKIGLAFGSFGWGGQSIKQVEEVLKDTGFEMLETIKEKYIPDDEKLNDITENLKKQL